jgi:hypothetical protein
MQHPRIAVGSAGNAICSLGTTRLTSFLLHAVLSGQQPLDSFS